MIELTNDHFAFSVGEGDYAILNAETLDVFKYSGTKEGLSKAVVTESACQSEKGCPCADVRMPEGTLAAVTLCVSENCNLACKYCYADAGAYGQSQGKNMTIDDMRLMFERLIMIYPSGVMGITFFGGEPMLAFSQIEKFVEYVSSTTKKRGLRTPLFALVTNGTLIDSHAWQVFNDYSFHVTVSLDGPKDVNDAMRVYAHGNASVHDDVASNLINQVKRTFSLCAEATLTLDFFLSYRQGTIESYMKSFFHLGFDSVSPFLAESKETDWQDKKIVQNVTYFYSDFTDYCFMSLLASDDSYLHVPSFILKPIISILKKQKRTGCSAGKESLFYTYSGDVYPCQMYYGNPKYAIGNIDNLEELQRTVQNRQRLTCENVSDCETCFSRGFCSLWCPGGAFLFAGSETNANPARCLIQRIVAERVICGLVSVFKSNEADRFIRNMTKLSNKFSRSSFFEGNDYVI